MKAVTLKRHPLALAIGNVLRVWHLQALARR
jgi:hypothetical protein